jgi:hypothetical protein
VQCGGIKMVVRSRTFGRPPYEGGATEILLSIVPDLSRSLAAGGGPLGRPNLPQLARLTVGMGVSFGSQSDCRQCHYEMAAVKQND